MATFKFTLKPRSAFATALQGDTLFGQLCWAILRSYGEDKLQTLLTKYASAPFAVVSDAFPAGYLPKPHLPQVKFGASTSDPKERKALKRKHWIPVAAAAKPVAMWIAEAKTDKEILDLLYEGISKAGVPDIDALQIQHKRMHNSINRLTGTTGEGGFAPYGVQELWFAPHVEWEIYIVLDESQLSLDSLTELLVQIGQSGYGKDASIGAGKFIVSQPLEAWLPHHPQANAFLALSAIAPQGLPLKGDGCFCQPFTRFGRHGDWAVLVNPYKAPILMAKTGAVLLPSHPDTCEYFGQSLGGHGEISRIIPTTVHQGYAPVLRIGLNV